MATLDTLAGDFATDKPDLADMSFPGPVAAAAYADDNPIVGIQGPVGSGKTTTMLYSRMRRALSMPRSAQPILRHGQRDHWRLYKLLVVRETYRQLWSTTIPDFLKVYPKQMGEWVGGRGGPVTYTMPFEDEFGPIEFIAEFMAFGDDIEASMRGFQATDIWLHEMDTNPVEVLGNGITRINRWPDKAMFDGYPPEMRSYGQLVGDFNAPEEDNWVATSICSEAGRENAVADLNRSAKAKAEAEGLPYRPIKISYYRQPGYGEDGAENLHNLAPGYYETAIAANRLIGKGYLNDRLIHNRVTTTQIGTPVYKREWNTGLHVRKDLEPIRELPLMLGLDQGFLGAAVIAQFKPPFHWRIYREMMFPEERLMAAEFGRRLKELLRDEFRGFRVECAYGDMAGEQGSSLADDEIETWNRLVGRTAGFMVRPQTVGTNRITPRLEAVRAALEFLRAGEPGLLVDESCRHLIRGFEGRYVWTTTISPKGDKRKVPDKSQVEANAHDALQYLLLSQSRADGTHPQSFGQQPADPMIGHNGGPPLAEHGGLQTDFDILDPYRR